jgi:hypothetical protein
LQQSFGQSKLLGNTGRLAFNEHFHIRQVPSKDRTNALRMHFLQVRHVLGDLGQAGLHLIRIRHPIRFLRWMRRQILQLNGPQFQVSIGPFRQHEIVGASRGQFSISRCGGGGAAAMGLVALAQGSGAQFQKLGRQIAGRHGVF